MQQIGIVRRNGLGDLLCVMPLVRLCKQRFPGCQVTLFVDERGAPLVPYLEGIDQTIVLPSLPNKYVSFLKTAWENRYKKFDLLISAKPSPMKLLNLFLYFLRGKKRIAYVDKAWHSRLINEPRPYDPKEERHQMVKSLRLLDPSFESVPAALRPRLRVSPSFQFDQKTLLVSVTNNRLGSTLDMDKTQRILNQIKKPFKLIINCQPADFDRAKLLAKGLSIPSEVTPTPSFKTFISLIASVDAFFIGDGGIMHLAAALDKPQVVLFGGTKMWEWAPLSEKAICLGDAHNVNFIPEEAIVQAVEKII
ncbi:MAG TPA: glycosyltransferase family 9 protein [Rhabdochlamydiaceae bacterium]|jgi:ADP-heptose:LPS heptosyltransferase|nr:glycosyltransferase family 9 protein [Rhabdochlamydiaceae bacterium]